MEAKFRLKKGGEISSWKFMQQETVICSARLSLLIRWQNVVAYMII